MIPPITARLFGGVVERLSSSKSLKIRAIFQRKHRDISLEENEP
jgi:hypothetical protein